MVLYEKDSETEKKQRNRNYASATRGIKRKLKEIS
jgi:hypothetical protein